MRPTCRRFGILRPVAAVGVAQQVRSDDRGSRTKDDGDRSPNTKAVTGHRTPKSRNIHLARAPVCSIVAAHFPSPTFDGPDCSLLKNNRRSTATPANKPSNWKRRVKVRDLPPAEDRLTGDQMNEVKGGAQMNMQFLSLQSQPQTNQTDKPRNPDTASK